MRIKANLLWLILLFTIGCRPSISDLSAPQPVEMSAVQRARTGDIFGKPVNPDSDRQATPLDKAVNLLNDKMKPTFSELRNETNAQIRRQ